MPPRCRRSGRRIRSSFPTAMGRIVSKILALALALGLMTPRRALAEEVRSSGAPPPAIVLLRAPISLDLPARAALLAPAKDRLRSPRSPFASPPAREVRLSEDGMLVVGAAAVV